MNDIKIDIRNYKLWNTKIFYLLTDVGSVGDWVLESISSLLITVRLPEEDELSAIDSEPIMLCSSTCEVDSFNGNGELATDREEFASESDIETSCTDVAPSIPDLYFKHQSHIQLHINKSERLNCAIVICVFSISKIIIKSLKAKRVSDHHHPPWDDLLRQWRIAQQEWDNKTSCHHNSTCNAIHDYNRI